MTCNDDVLSDQFLDCKRRRLRTASWGLGGYWAYPALPPTSPAPEGTPSGSESGAGELGAPAGGGDAGGGTGAAV